MIIVNIFKDYPCPFSARWIKNLISRSARILKCSGQTVEIIIVGDNEIKRINKKCRGFNRVTDVLSFAWEEDKKVKSDILGQIYLCYPQIVRQARERKISTKEECARMLVHGLMHLLGHDHITLAQEKKMFSLQEKIVLKILRSN